MGSNPFAAQTPSAKANLLLQIRPRLLALIDHYFNHSDTELIPDEFTILLGGYFNIPIKLPSAKNDRFKRLNLPNSHALAFDTTSVSVFELSGGLYEFSADTVFSSTGLSNMVLKPISRTMIRADLVWDDIDEMRRAGYSYANAVAKLSLNTREKNFNRPLNQTLVPYTVSRGFASQFHKFGANSATYDTKLNYYAKWRKSRPTDQSDRVFSFDNLSDNYLRENYVQHLLKKDTPHLYLNLDDEIAVFEFRATSAGLKPHLVVSSSGFGDRPIFDEVFDKLPNAKSKLAVFFHTFDGGSRTPVPIRKRSVIPKARASSQKRLVDPRCMVKNMWGVKCNVPDIAPYETWDDKRWFNEMMILFFPSRIVELTSKDFGMLTSLDREDLFLKHLEKPRTDSKGPLKARLDQSLVALRADKDLLLLPRGIQVGKDELLLGSDGNHVYTREISIGVTSRIEMADFVYNFTVADVSRGVYEKSAGMIPFLMLVSFIGTLGVVGAALGAAALVTGFRFIVRDIILAEATRSITKKTIKRIKKQFRNQIDALLLYVIATLFHNRDAPADRFVLGFLRGYSIDAIDTMFSKISDLPLRGPRYYRWLKGYTKIKASIQRLENKIEQIKGMVDNRTADLMAAHVVQIGTEMHQGLTLLYGSIFFLDFEKAAPVLEIISDASATKMPDKREWEKLRKTRFKKMLNDYHREIKLAAHEAEQTSNDIYEILGPSLAIASYSADVATAVKLSGTLVPVSIAGMIAGLGGLAYLDVTENDSKGVSKFSEIVIRQFSPEHLAKMSPKEAEKTGEIFGHLLGAIMLNRSTFSQDTFLGNLSGNKRKKAKGRKTPFDPVAELVKDELGHSLLMPILNVLLFNYIILFDRIKPKATKLWDRIDKEIRKIALNEDPDLKPFFTPEEGKITIGRLHILFTRLDEILVEQLAPMAMDPDLPSQLKSMAESLNHINVPTFDDMLAAESPDNWSDKAATFVVLAHLQTALHSFSTMINLTVADIAPNSPASIRLVDFLSLLGLQFSDDAAYDEMAKDLDDLFGDPSEPTNDVSGNDSAETKSDTVASEGMQSDQT